MAGSVNKVILIGHLGADPEVKSFPSGGQVANFRLATSESWTDRATNARKERTEWHSVVVTNEALVSVVQKYLRKGSKAYVEGQLRTRKWQDRDGQDRYTTEVVVGGYRGQLVLLDRAEGGPGRAGAGSAADYEGPGSGAAPPAGGQGGFHDLDDDVPF
jgi:single-strand DNA-binding protein